MKVVYPYRKTASRELQWSIASLKNIEHNGVLVVGDKPDYRIDADYFYHSPGEFSSSPHHDQAVKYLLACAEVEDDDLLLMNDDFFIMKEWKPENYNKGILFEQIAQRNDAYGKALANTEQFLLAHGYSTFNYEMHTPMLVEREKLRIALDEIMPYMQGKQPILIRSYYGNRWDLKTPRKNDVKNIQNYKDATLLSTSDESFVGEIGSYIRETLV